MLSAECRDKKIESFRDLIVWQRSMQLANKVYDAALNFPKEELFGLTNQMRRSAVSVASNIAEGSQRGSRKEFIQFLSISRGSLAELETQLILASDRNFVTKEEYHEIHNVLNEVSKMLMRLIQSLKQ